MTASQTESEPIRYAHPVTQRIPPQDREPNVADLQKKIRLLECALAECHKEIFRLRDELLRQVGPTEAKQQ